MLEAPHLHSGSIESAAPDAAAPDAALSAAAAVSSIRRAADLLRRLMTADFSESGVNNARYEALKSVGRPASEGRSQAELAAELNQSESSVSGLVSRMRADGLMYRLRSKQDQRKRLLMLSARGRSLLAECEESRQRQVERLLGRFDAGMLRQLSERLDWLIDELAQPAAADTVDRTSHQPRSQEPVRRSA